MTYVGVSDPGDGSACGYRAHACLLHGSARGQSSLMTSTFQMSRRSWRFGTTWKRPRPGERSVFEVTEARLEALAESVVDVMKRRRGR